MRIALDNVKFAFYAIAFVLALLMVEAAMVLNKLRSFVVAHEGDLATRDAIALANADRGARAANHASGIGAH